MQKSEALTSLSKMYLALKLLKSNMKGLLAIICSNFFSNYKVDQMKTVAYSQIFHHVYSACILYAFFKKGTQVYLYMTYSLILRYCYEGR